MSHGRQHFVDNNDFKHIENRIVSRTLNFGIPFIPKFRCKYHKNECQHTIDFFSIRLPELSLATLADTPHIILYDVKRWVNLKVPHLKGNRVFMGDISKLLNSFLLSIIDGANFSFLMWGCPYHSFNHFLIPYFKFLLILFCHLSLPLVHNIVSIRIALGNYILSLSYMCTVTV